MKLCYFIIMSVLLGLMVINPMKADTIAKYEKEFLSMNASQLHLLQKIYIKAKPYNLQHTAVAIAWQESALGVASVNLQDPSCGPFHQHIVYYLRRKKIPNNSFNRNKFCTMFINDFDFAFNAFIETWRLWEAKHKNKIAKHDLTIRSYNAGVNVNSQAAIRYRNQVKTRQAVIMKYFKEETFLAQAK